MIPFKRKDKKVESQYLEGFQTTVKFSRLSTVLYAVLCSMLALVFFGGAISSGLLNSGTIAYADGDEDKAKEKIEEAAKGYIPETEEGEEGTALFPTLDKASGDSNVEDYSFGYLINRLFTINYLNETGKGYSTDEKNYPVGRQCSADNPNAGTPIYHNCDVPNILTELVQDFLSTGTQQGIVGGNKASATEPASIFGLPQGIPADGAPVNPDERAVKYTGLELYGYNFNYSTYNGEWDHIKVMTTARAMSNFGFMDDFKMGVTSVAQGVAGGVQQGATNFVDGMSNGDFFGAIGGGFTGFWSGAASNSINSILDTSDHNVFTTNSWYRVDYGGTLYNARELTETEMAARTQNTLIAMLTSSAPELATTPAELQAIQDGPANPKEAISKCVITNEHNSKEEIGNGEIAPGVTKAECEKVAQTAFEIRERTNDPDSKDKAKYTWDAEGNQKLETLVQWKKNNKKMFDTADKYNLQCDVNESEAVRQDTLASFRVCWTSTYAIVSKNVQNVEQTEGNLEWLANLFDPANLSAWITGNHDDNFNAPWNRYVCVDSKGKDVLDDNGQPVRLYDYNGDMNEGCKPVRPPIQNGFFGNGYLPGDAKPGVDTRYVSSGDNFMQAVIPFNRIVSSIGNVGLTVASFATKVSNTVISLSFNPLLKALGIDDLIVELIEGLRDSLFFPLIALIVGLSALQIMWNVGRKKDYGSQAISILMICLTIIGGVFLMFRPAQTVKAVDEIPAMIETAIMGSIFSAGNRADDQLCYATGSIAKSDFIDLDGKATGIGTNEGVRVLMCENWRTFAFNPWVAGQWGTDYSNLYSENSGMASKMQNTNTALVGDASVKMGGGITVKNWALYQLDSTTSGTAYYKDLMTPTGRVDTDMYRIVDMQAGPNDGAGTDGRYFEDWKGSGFSRLVIGPLSGIVAIFGAATIITYSIAKIQIAFVLTFMVLLMPFMFLFGIHPTMGRSKLKGYIGTIIGLMVQRIVLVTILAVLFRIVTQLGAFSQSYSVSAAFIIAVCVFFLKARKEILRFVFEGVSRGFGQPIGQQFMDNPKQWIDKNVRNKETSRGLLANNLERAKYGATAFAGGAIGGVMSGGGKGAWNNIKKEAVDQSKNSLARLKNRQRHRGYGLAQTMIESRQNAEEQTAKRLNKHKYANDARAEMFEQTKPYQDYKAKLKAYESVDAEETFEKIEKVNPDNPDKPILLNQGSKIDENGETVLRPEKPEMPEKFADNVGSSRRLSTQIKSREQQDILNAQRREENSSIVRESSDKTRKFVEQQNELKRIREWNQLHPDDQIEEPTEEELAEGMSGVNSTYEMAELSARRRKVPELRDASLKNLNEQKAKLKEAQKILNNEERAEKVKAVKEEIAKYRKEVEGFDDELQNASKDSDDLTWEANSVKKYYDNDITNVQHKQQIAAKQGAKINDKKDKNEESIREAKEMAKEMLKGLFSRAKENDD